LSKPDLYRGVRDKYSRNLIIGYTAIVIMGAWLLSRLYCGTTGSLWQKENTSRTCL